MSAADDNYVVSLNKIPKAEVIVFLLMDLLFLFRSMVVITDKMEESVDYHPVEFLIKLGPIFQGILSDRVDTYEKVPGQSVPFTIVESDDVSEIVMLKVTHVHIQDVVVGTEYYVNVSDGFDFAARNHFQPTVVRLFVLENKLYILAIIPDHDQKFPQIYNY